MKILSEIYLWTMDKEVHH